ncbi:hypothetical protein BN159_1237 [Streptomyces davaonensis JCM 4913]|uniref:DUF8175 domain-containing protein n=1 Tax=Streptomyces davaonensis (strain DSM 101723 / JCM 4913 / KCC S-0913 / 768) TaxID=1214101 RepID=K4QT16_STRDJ|nr:hypothetical protein [Streptomyces davaonensis]CCK25616.1 hypothetical protein BN159_1237 [Streptomyces davaonensis JCM 4913]
MFTRRQRWADEPEPYWKQRSWQLSAGFLAVVLVLGGIVALTSGGETGTDRARAAAAGPLSGDAAPRDGRPQGCATDDSAGDALPKAPPDDVSWDTLGITRVPVSASAGPTRTTGTLRWCFARTPIGAVLAAHVIPSQMSGSGWRTVTEQQVVAGAGRDMFEFQRSTVQDIDSGEQTGDAAVATYAGFTVTSYKSTAASVKLLLRTSQGYAATTIVLRWSGGDWKVLPNGDGSLHTPVTAVQGNTSGYTLWGD